jgi:hypothetical protein
MTKMGTIMAGKRKTIILLLALSMALLLRVPASAAQEPVFRLDADSLNLQRGVRCNIVVSLINAQNAQIFSIDDLDNFDVISQNQRSSSTIINGAVSSQIDIYITILPKATGQFTLKANIQYNGQNYESNSLQVTVTDGSGNGSGSAPNLFAKTILSHEEAYLGEKIIVTYELYARDYVDSFEFTDYSAIDGVIAKEAPKEDVKNESIYVDGERYAKYEAKRIIIDPIKSGALVIPSFSLKVNVITDDTGMGGGFPGFPSGFFQTVTPQYIQTEEKELAVKPLPSEGKPNNFSGIVGELELNGQYSREEMNYGDSFILQVEASGHCNLDGMKNVFSGAIPDFTVYETLKNTVESVIDNQYYTQKVFEAIMIPEKTGAIDIQPPSISYFNPVTGKYETAKIPGATINVLGDMPQAAGIGGDQSGRIDKVTINQVNYADQREGYFAVQIQKNLAYAVLIGIVFLLILAAGFFWFISRKKKQDSALIAIYKELMNAKDINETYNLFNAMIKHCYNVNLKANTKNAIIRCLPDAELSAKVTDVMDYVESDEAYDEKGCTCLKDKIRSIYLSGLQN